MSRNRSLSLTSKGLRATLNPDRHHFVYEWIKYYLDDEGFPDKELSGKLRYYYRIDGVLITGWDKEELLEKYGVPDSKGVIDPPESYTYIPATLEDNEILTNKNPKYRAKLNAMPERTRKQLLLGCWADEEDFGRYFKRGWLSQITTDQLPRGITWVRGYDLGYSAPSPDNPKPDFTASVLMGRDRLGNVYIKGNYHKDFKDDDTEVYGAFRKTIGKRDVVMVEQAKADGKNVYIGLPREGAGGKEVYHHKVKMFTKEGFIVKQDPSPANSNKMRKFEAFSSYCESGLVSICTDTFNKETLENFYSLLERFNPEKNSTSSYKDDMPDAAATAFNVVMQMKVTPIVIRNQLDINTISSDLIRKYL